MDNTRNILSKAFGERTLSGLHRIRRRSAVLIPVIYRNNVPHILFEVRSSELDVQPGEICFPGGTVEKAETPLSAAVRETCEELMVRKEQIEVFGHCHLLSRSFDEYIVSCAGIIRDYEDTFSEHEVGSVFMIPLSDLLETEPEIHDAFITTVPGDDFPYDLIPGGRDYPFRRTERKMYFYKTEFGVIWGITAEFLYMFLEDMRKEITENDALTDAAARPAFSQDSLDRIMQAFDNKEGRYALTSDRLSIRYGDHEGITICRDKKGYCCTRHRERSNDDIYLENEVAAVECFLKEIPHAKDRWENDEYPFGNRRR